MMKLLLVYLFLINATGFLLMLVDQHNARKKLWRIPERTLIAVTAIGGSLGSLLGMYLLRHKTKHLKFTLWVPLLFFLQACGLLLLFL